MQDGQMLGAGGVTVSRHAIAGRPVCYVEYAAQGPSRGDVLLVHGLASSGLQFEREAERFARQGYRVLVPDLRGHGVAGVPEGPIANADFAISVMAADLVAVLDHAGAQQVHWVGNSLGGILALWLLGTPEGERIRSLVLFGTCISMDLPRGVERLFRLAFLPGAAVTAWVTARTTTANPVGQKSIAAAIRQVDVGAGAAIVANLRRYDFVANAQAYRRPLLVLWGAGDHAVNLRLRRDIGKFEGQANFRRIDLPRGGHCANFDMPEEFCGALEAHWMAAEALRAVSNTPVP